MPRINAANSIVRLTEPSKDRTIPKAIKIFIFNYIAISKGYRPPSPHLTYPLRALLRIRPLSSTLGLQKSKRLMMWRLAERTIRFVYLFSTVCYKVNRVYLDFPTFGWIMTYFSLLFGSLCFIKCSRLIKDFLQMFLLLSTRVCIERNWDADYFFVQDWQIRWYYYSISDSYLYRSFCGWILTVDRIESGLARWFIQSVQCIYISETPKRKEFLLVTRFSCRSQINVSWISESILRVGWLNSHSELSSVHLRSVCCRDHSLPASSSLKKGLVIHQCCAKTKSSYFASLTY